MRVLAESPLPSQHFRVTVTASKSLHPGNRFRVSRCLGNRFRITASKSPLPTQVPSHRFGPQLPSRVTASGSPPPSQRFGVTTCDCFTASGSLLPSHSIQDNDSESPLQGLRIQIIARPRFESSLPGHHFRLIASESLLPVLYSGSQLRVTGCFRVTTSGSPLPDLRFRESELYQKRWQRNEETESGWGRAAS